MGSDERNNQSFRLPEAVKEARIRKIKDRFDKALPQKRTSFAIGIPIPETSRGWAIFYITVIALTALLIATLARIL